MINNKIYLIQCTSYFSPPSFLSLVILVSIMLSTVVVFLIVFFSQVQLIVQLLELRPTHVR